MNYYNTFILLEENEKKDRRESIGEVRVPCRDEPMSPLPFFCLPFVCFVCFVVNPLPLRLCGRSSSAGIAVLGSAQAVSFRSYGRAPR